MKLVFIKKAYGSKKNTSFTSSILAAPKQNTMYAALTMDELRHAEQTGRIGTDDLYLSPYPHMAADDARLGLMGDRDTPAPNKPTFVVEIKLPSTSGLRPVPHGVPMWTKNTPIPFSDVQSIHEVTVGTQSGMNQFRRMGGMAKANSPMAPTWKPVAPGALPITPHPPHSESLGGVNYSDYPNFKVQPPHFMEKEMFRATSRRSTHTGVSGPTDVEGERMPIFSTKAYDAKEHQKQNSWSQDIRNNGHLSWSRPTIEKLLATGKYHLYPIRANDASKKPIGDSIRDVTGFHENYGKMQDNFENQERADMMADSYDSAGLHGKADEVRGRMTNYHLTQFPEQPKIHHLFGHLADLRQSKVWKHEILPYLAEHHMDNVYDRALVDHAQNNISHQETYGDSPRAKGSMLLPELYGSPDSRELRKDHSMWHMVDRSPGLKKWLLDRGYSGATIPNYFRPNDTKDPYGAIMMANQDAISHEPITPENSANDISYFSDPVHAKILERAAKEGKTIPKNVWNTQTPEQQEKLSQLGADVEPPDTWEKPLQPWDNITPEYHHDNYDAFRPPIQHYASDRGTVAEAAKEQLREMGIPARQLSSGFLRISDWQDNPKVAEPHALVQSAKNIVATAFGVDPSVFSRLAYKFPAHPPVPSLKGAAGWEGMESLSGMAKHVLRSAQNPQLYARALATMVHETIHSLQEEAAGHRHDEADRRFRNFSFRGGHSDPDWKKNLEGHTELMAHVLTSAALGKEDVDHYGNIAYLEHVRDLVVKLQRESNDDPKKALHLLMVGTLRPDLQETKARPNPDERHENMEEFVDAMTNIAAGKPQNRPKTSKEFNERYVNNKYKRARSAVFERGTGEVEE